MANAPYPSFKLATVKADFDWDTADWRLVLVDLADYTYSAAHDSLDDVPAGARVATATLSGETVALVSTNPVLDTDDSAFPSVTGDASEAVILYDHTGATDADRRLAYFWDTGVTGLPVTPNGANINVTISANGLLRLTG